MGLDGKLSLDVGVLEVAEVKEIHGLTASCKWRFARKNRQTA